MTMNKALLAQALGVAMTACSNSQQAADSAAAEATDAAGEAPQGVDNAAAPGNDPAAGVQTASGTAAQAADATAVSVDAAAAGGSVTGADAAEPRDSAEETAAPADAKTDNAPAVIASPTAVATQGKALYEATCIACHGPKAQGAIPGVPDLAQGGRLAKSDAELSASILNGFQTKGSPMAMPPKGGNPSLTAEDAKALVLYLRTLARPSK